MNDINQNIPDQIRDISSDIRAAYSKIDLNKSKIRELQSEIEVTEQSIKKLEIRKQHFHALETRMYRDQFDESMCSVVTEETIELLESDQQYEKITEALLFMITRHPMVKILNLVITMQKLSYFKNHQPSKLERTVRSTLSRMKKEGLIASPVRSHYILGPNK